MGKFTLILARMPLDDVRIWDMELTQEAYQKIIDFIAQEYEKTKRLPK